MGLFGRRESPRQKKEAQEKAHRDKVVREHGPRAARNILREENPGRYEFLQPSDLDTDWDFLD